MFKFSVSFFVAALTFFSNCHNQAYCEDSEILTPIEIAKKEGPQKDPKFSNLDKATEEYLNKLLKKKQGNVSESQLLKQKTSVRGFIQSKNFYNAIDNLENIIAQNPKNFHNWFLYFYCLVQEEKEYSGNREDSIKKAGTLTRLLATNPLENAILLWVFAELPKADKNLFAEAIQLAPEVDIKAKIEALIKNYPPKFAAYGIDKPDNPGFASACLNLTHPLPHNRGIDYGQYIHVEPALQDFRVSGRQSNLCVDGFLYGKDYTIHLKPGLKSANHLELKEAQKFSIYIDHRKPRLSFREKGYIVPASGPQMLPLNTLNLKESYIELYHLPERGLTGLEPHEFLTNMRGWNAHRIKSEKSVKIWGGKITTDGVLNETITHGIPLSKIIQKQLEPGIYFLTAGIKEQDGSNDENGFSVQWFIVSDIGLSIYEGPDGAHIFANHLSNAAPIPGLELSLVSRSNRILGKVTTDAQGHGHFEKPLTQGLDGNRPEFVFAQKSGDKAQDNAQDNALDFAFLQFASTGFDFKDRGVQGRQHKHALDGYLYSEKGIYRPGEEVHFIGLLRDLFQKPVLNEKITLKLFKPNTQEAYVALSEDQGAGSYAWDYALQASAPQGAWKASLYHDPKGEPIAETTFEVNDFVPPKIDLRLQNLHETMSISDKFEVQLDVHYYYGAPGSDLDVSGDMELKKSVDPFKDWKNTFFGFEEDPFTPIRLPLPTGKTDEKGMFLLSQEIKAQSDLNAPLLLEAKINVFEQGGRALSKTTQSIIHHKPFYIGLRPQFRDRVANAQKADFKIIAITPEDKLLSKSKLSYALYEEIHDYTWYRASNSVNYENNIRDKVISRGEIETFEDKASLLNVAIQYGRYRLEVTDPETGIGSSFRFSSGWSYASDHPDRPDLLDLQLDQKSYVKGGNLIASIKAPFGGHVSLLAIGQDIKTLFQGKLDADGLVQTISLDANLCKGPGFYLVAIALRPLDSGNQQMPARAIGVAWVNLSDAVQSVKLDIDIPQDVIRPNSTLSSKLKYEPNLKNAFATIALVDEAVLNLTNYQSPNPLKYFSSQLDLAYKIFDSYGKLINPFGAILNDALVGGDGMFARMMSILPGRSFKTISMFTGILPLDEKGETEFSFDIPEFDGKVRMMAVLWSDDKIANADRQIHVRDEVVHDLSLPRFIAPHDQTIVPFMLHNMEGQVGKYEVAISTEGDATLSPSKFAFDLARNEKRTENLELKVESGLDGVQNFTIDLKGPNEYTRQNHWQLSLRSPLMDQVKRDFKVVAPDTPLTLDAALLNGFDPQKSALKLEVSAIPSFGTLKIANDLQKYPYSCLEQTSSSIYGFSGNVQENADKIHERLARLYALQSMEGDFTVWPDSYWNDHFMSCFALDTLMNLKSMNFQVSENVINQGTKFLRNLVERDPSTSNKSTYLLALQEQAYAHYLLAKSQKNALSQIRYFSDNHKKTLSKSMIASAFIGATYSYLGDKQEAFVWFKKAFIAKSGDYRSYGSPIRDLALTLSLITESTEGYPQLMAKAQELAASVAAKNYLSTQEMAWILRASRELQKTIKNQDFVFDGNTYQGSDAKIFELTFAELNQAKILNNKSPDPLFVTLIAEGKIQENGIFDKEISDKGFKISREIFSTDGTKITDNSFKQGEQYVVALKGEIVKPIAEQIVVADLLPAGFEIDNAHPYKNLDRYPFLSNVIAPLMAEGRDDRFVSSFKAEERMNQFTLAYVVRASFKGSFTFPAPYVESMYRPEFFGQGARGQMMVVPRE
jgi:uncharacterized protein YfaS (alpha-2-macroglobulin family)